MQFYYIFTASTLVKAIHILCYQNEFRDRHIFNTEPLCNRS